MCRCHPNLTERLLDNLEWSLGFAKRFGIVHVNLETQERTIKDSGRLYSQIIESNVAVLGSIQPEAGAPVRSVA